MHNTKNKKALTDLSLEELTEAMPGLGYPKFRAKQVWQWIYRSGARSIKEMTNLPPHLKKDLEEAYAPFPNLTVVDRQVSKVDKTEKLLFGLNDGNLIESVLIRAPRRNTACISTQVGCAMGCKFCASTGPGFVRNLTTSEIVEQILLMNEHLSENDRLSNIVFMGIGEPLLNYEHVMKSISIFIDPFGLQIGIRKITISTCGIIPGIRRLAKDPLKPRLAISLHHTNNVNRSKIMPINEKYNVHELINEVKSYYDTIKRQVMFEYLLIHDFNDSEEHALRLIKLCKDIPCSFNLIAYNPVPGLPYNPALPANCEKFKMILIQRGFRATLRFKKGNDITAACGQLRAHTLKNQ